MDLFFEFMAWGLPQAAIALMLAGALGIVTLIILHKRGPMTRLASESVAFFWACLYWAAGLLVWLLAGYAWLATITSSTAGIAYVMVVLLVTLVAPMWYAQLWTLAAAAGRLGGRSMHLMLAATTLAGAAAAWATPVVVMQLLKFGWMSDDGAAIPMILGTMPLGSAIAGLAVAPFLPVGRFPKGRCMNCGYDLAGLPASAKTDGALRCPECGYHPSAPAPPAG
jgi:hypothetical protein